MTAAMAAAGAHAEEALSELPESELSQEAGSDDARDLVICWDDFSGENGTITFVR